VIALEAHPQGTILPIKVHAGARKNAIRGTHAGSLQVSVTQAPEKGKANKAVLALLATALNLRKSQLEVVAGETSPQKRVLLRDVRPEEIAVRLQELCEKE